MSQILISVSQYKVNIPEPRRLTGNQFSQMQLRSKLTLGSEQTDVKVSSAYRSDTTFFLFRWNSKNWLRLGKRKSPTQILRSKCHHKYSSLYPNDNFTYLKECLIFDCSVVSEQVKATPHWLHTNHSKGFLKRLYLLKDTAY